MQPKFNFYEINSDSDLNVRINLVSDTQETLIFSQLLRKRKSVVTERNEDKETDQILPLIGLSSCLLTGLVLLLVVLSLVRRSKDYCREPDKLTTHVAFNQGIEPAKEPDLVKHGLKSQQRVHSLDQLNHVTFEGFSLSSMKYNTLPISPVCPVKRVTFSSSVSSIAASIPDLVLDRGTQQIVLGEESSLI